MRFKTWLLKQTDRQDRIRDLARDAEADRANWTNEKTLRARITYDLALETLDEAVAEWRAEGKIGGERGPDEGGRQNSGSRSGREAEVTTFAGWLKGQVSRGDAVGYAAKYWESVTPGKISAVSGIEKHLGKIQADYEVQPEGMEEAAWLHGKAQIDAALSGLKFAVDEYHQAQALEVAQATGAVPKLASVPDIDPELPPAQGHPVERGLEGSGADLHITAAPDPARDKTGRTEREPQVQVLTGPATEYPPAWAARIEARLDAIVEMLDLVYRGLFGSPEIDWDELAAMADYEAVAE